MKELINKAHTLLKRQLRRHGASLEELDEPWRRLLDAVDSAYKDFDDDRRMLERSLDLSSQELLHANAELRRLLEERKNAQAELERRVQERTATLTDLNRRLESEIQERKVVEASLRHSQEQLLHAQKMEAIGLLAGGLAHDFNNLLTVITGCCDLLGRQQDAGAEQRELVRHIDGATTRACALTRQLLAFSRRQVLQPQVMSLTDSVLGVEAIIRRLVGENIEVEIATDPHLPPVIADLGQIEQVLMNLVINARDAMPSGGRLSIETARALPEEVAARGRRKPHVRLSVRDTGCGIAPEIKGRIFEPFFTTKTAGKGSGLGLSTVYGIVGQTGGFLHVDSEPDRGSTFSIYVPATSRSRDTPGDEPPGLDGLPRGSETLLLVEDEALVRRLVKRMLEDLGYTVLDAGTPNAALALFAERGARIDGLVTDVIMPQMSGRELACQLKQRAPDLKVLFISGYTDDALTERGVLGPGMALLEKPFSREALARKIRDVLLAPAEAGPGSG